MLKFTCDETYHEPCALLLGGFDGLHTGHLTLLDAAKKTGYPVGITSISGGKAGGDLFTFAEREVVYERAGIGFVIEMPFTERLKQTSAEDFLRDLFGRFRPQAIFCGEDFRFGNGALGTPALLGKYAPCPVNVLPLKRVGGEKVAVSSVKEQLAAGNCSEANALLLGGYFLQGTVEHGRQVGRTYGFPTLNLSFPEGKFLLREGVYGGFAETPEGAFPAILNFGARPTFGVCVKKAEAYLDGFSGDLYGETVRLYPKEFFRPIVRFDDVSALKRQLEQDQARLKGNLSEEQENGKEKNV